MELNEYEIKSLESVNQWVKEKHVGFGKKILDIISKPVDYLIEKIGPQKFKMFESAAQEEKDWASYLFKDGSIIGLSEQIVHQYIDWLCMSRRKAIGLPYENVGKNPIAGWTEAWMNSESVQVAPQEHEITSYKIGASKNDLDEMDLGGLL